MNGLMVRVGIDATAGAPKAGLETAPKPIKTWQANPRLTGQFLRAEWPLHEGHPELRAVHLVEL